MDTGGIEWVVAVRNAQEAGALLECLGPQPRYLFERLAGAERTMGVAVQDDILRETCSDSRYAANNGAEAMLASTPTALTQSSTTASSERDSLVSLRSC